MSRRSITRGGTVWRAFWRSQPAAGFTLIELMVAMLLGLIVIGGVVSVFLANQRTYRTNEALSDVQDGSRIAFEFMARDIRNAGLSGCDSSSGRVANTLNPSATNWWADWSNALHGYANATAIDDPALTALPTTGATSPVIGQNSVQVISTGGMGLTVDTDKEPAANFKLNESTSDLQPGDVIMVCDPDHTTIVQITGPSSSNLITIVHNANGSTNPTPGNCSKGLGYPTDCSSQNGNIYSFGHNSRIAKLTAADWYIGINPVGGKSLYRLTLINNAGSLTTQAQEMVRNVTNMTINYVQPPSTAFVNASGVTGTSSLGPPPTGWAAVNTAQVTLRLQSTDQRAGTDTKPITRSFTYTATVRNRVN